MRRIALAVLLLAGLAAPLFAQSTRPDAMSPADRAREYIKLNRELHDVLGKKDYESAGGLCRRMIELVPNQSEPHYNLACCLARLGRIDEALAELKKAIDLGFTDVGHIREDEDLAGLRELPRFRQMLDDVASREKAAADKVYEKAPKLSGVRTIEGDPEGGLRWRLHMRQKPSTQPERLIVWLHPSGGSLNGTVEPLAPNFVKSGYALLVLTAKDWRGWSGVDSKKLLDKVLPDVAKVKGVDIRRPILFGFSAGGQLALTLWYQSPEKWGGLVLDAAYPIIPNPATRRYNLMTPPAKAGVKDCPFFVLVGENDTGGAGAWRLAEDPYSAAGVPVVVYYIPGQGHAWLFGGAQREKLYAWLRDVADGKKPGSPAAARPAPPTTQRDLGPIRIQDVY